MKNLRAASRPSGRQPRVGSKWRMRDEIRKYKYAMPFRPFRLYLADGTELPVHDPVRIALSPEGTKGAVYLATSKLRIFSLHLVVRIALEGKPPRARSRRRGRK